MYMYMYMNMYMKMYMYIHTKIPETLLYLSRPYASGFQR